MILGAVEAALRERGLSRLYGAACALYGVLSVALGLTVWCDGRTITWRQDGEEASWPAGDPEGAAKHLADLAGGIERAVERAVERAAPEPG